MAEKRILSVGQCCADHGSISQAIQQHFHAEVVAADSADQALELIRSSKYDLVLVNRILDLDHSPGLEIIRRMKADTALASTPVMLVSNYDDAQEEAVGFGALPGFGKAALGQPRMLARVRDALGE